MLQHKKMQLRSTLTLSLIQIKSKKKRYDVLPTAAASVHLIVRNVFGYRRDVR